jgi:hypothetical protein
MYEAWVVEDREAERKNAADDAVDAAQRRERSQQRGR